MRCVYCGTAYVASSIFILNGNSCCQHCVQSKKIKLHNQETLFTLLIELKQLKEKVSSLENKLNKKHHKSSSHKKEPKEEVIISKLHDTEKD